MKLTEITQSESMQLEQSLFFLHRLLQSLAALARTGESIAETNYFRYETVSASNYIMPKYHVC